ncbi:MAG: arsenic resistance N-acetyltransferase ArsN2 [Myxococcota bacterium]
MSGKFVLQQASEKDLDIFAEKLGKNDLPFDDICGKTQHLYFVKERDKQIGIVGLEVFEEYGLVRSLVVDASVRNRGYGRNTIESVIQLAKLKKLKALYLLTTTAEEFFRKLQFKPISREDVPHIVKQSEEFTRLCPMTAVCMRFFVDSCNGEHF